MISRVVQEDYRTLWRIRRTYAPLEVARNETWRGRLPRYIIPFIPGFASSHYHEAANSKRRSVSIFLPSISRKFLRGGGNDCVRSGSWLLRGGLAKKCCFQTLVRRNRCTKNSSIEHRAAVVSPIVLEINCFVFEAIVPALLRHMVLLQIVLKRVSNPLSCIINTWSI